MTSGGSDFMLSGCCPCNMSNRAVNARTHSSGYFCLVPRTSSNTLINPRPTILNNKINIINIQFT